uniref:Uncharacterized protein n=1 Tax=Panagrolaimus davidi TaxID=227884 RepID=A0A914PHP8_9BILA
MKFSVSFLLFVAVFQFGTSYVSSKRDVQELLLSDGYEIAVQNGSDVKMVKPGPLDVILKNASELIFKVCSSECNADFLVCYEPHPSGQNVLEDSCDTKCGFYITTLGDEISFMKPFSPNVPGVVKSDPCFEVKMTNGITSVLALERIITRPQTCAPKIVNGMVKLNIINATSDCVVSIKNAIIKHETTTAPPTTTTLGNLDRTSSGENGHASAATTDEPENFFADNWWIFLILGFILIAIGVGIGIGVFCYLRRKKNAPKPIPARRRRLQGSKSPIVLQPSTENQNGKTESAVRPNSLYNQSSILSHKSLLNSKKDEQKKAEPESTDLTSMKPTA